MSTSLQALETALGSIAEIGKEEELFPVGGIEVGIRSLLPDEEVAVQRFAIGALRDGEEEQDQMAVMDYLLRFKNETLALALVSVNGFDFRGVEFFETGEVTDQGKPIKVPKIDAVRKLVRKWDGGIVTAVFKKFTELQAKVEKIAENAVVFEPSDLEAEIERLEGRLESLQDKLKAQQAATEKSPMGEQAKAIASIDELGPEDRAKVISEFAKKRKSGSSSESAPEPVPEPVPELTPEPSSESAPGSRQPILPTQATPPVQKTQPRQQPQQQPQQDPLAGIQDSLVASSDMTDEIAAESNRLLAQRQGQASPPSGSVLGAMGQVPPPHLGAREAQADLEVVNPVPVGSRDGIQAFAFPPQELTRPPEKPTEQVSDTPRLDPTRNPRFRG